MVDYRETSGRAAVGAGVLVPLRESGRNELTERSRQTIRLSTDPRFVKLRRRFVAQTVILVVVFLGWYLAYLFLSIHAHGFMGRQVFGSINVALILGVGQLVSTVVLAWGYCLHAARRLDSLAVGIRDGAAAAETVGNGRVRQG